MNNPKTTLAALWSATITVLFVTALTITGDKHASVKSWLTTTFRQHWLGKSILAVVVFVMLTLVFSAVIKRTDSKALRSGLIVLITATVFGALVLVGFPLWEFWQK